MAEASTLSLEDKLEVGASCARPATQRSTAQCQALACKPLSRTWSCTPAANGHRAVQARVRRLQVWDLGAYGNGCKMKFIANHLVAIHNVAVAEAMVLAMKAGLDADRRG